MRKLDNRLIMRLLANGAPEVEKTANEIREASRRIGAAAAGIDESQILRLAELRYPGKSAEEIERILASKTTNQ